MSAKVVDPLSLQKGQFIQFKFPEILESKNDSMELDAISSQLKKTSLAQKAIPSYLAASTFSIDIVLGTSDLPLQDCDRMYCISTGPNTYYSYKVSKEGNDTLKLISTNAQKAAEIIPKPYRIELIVPKDTLSPAAGRFLKK
jgi:hypothetical protein